jgi:hypothetical protein
MKLTIDQRRMQKDMRLTLRALPVSCPRTSGRVARPREKLELILAVPPSTRLIWHPRKNSQRKKTHSIKLISR